MKTTRVDKWFSLYIRLRDCDENRLAKCCTCGKVVDVKYADCGHFIKRQHMATRFDEVNCAVQCKHCNAFEQGKDVDFERYILTRWGEEKLMMLKFAKRTAVTCTAFMLKMKADYWKEQARLKATVKGIELW